MPERSGKKKKSIKTATTTAAATHSEHKQKEEEEKTFIMKLQIRFLLQIVLFYVRVFKDHYLWIIKRSFLLNG